MLSKCIRRLSFRSIADDKPSLLDDNNNNHHKSVVHAPTPLKPVFDNGNRGTWTSALFSKMSPQAGSRGPATLPMTCRCHLLSCGDGSFVLSVVLSQAGRLYPGAGLEGEGEVVARSVVARNMQPGSIRVRLVSPVLELDPLMDSEVSKTEPNWNGADIEKQFVVRPKVGHSVHGLLGKVVVEQEDCGQQSPLFDLTLVSKQYRHTAGDMAWGAAGFRELASLLNLVDENDDFTNLAKDLGFTEHELSTKLLPSADPFAALLNTYHSRGGTPKELVRAMYSCSRVRGLGIVGGSPTPLSRALSQSSMSSLCTCTTPAHGTLPLDDELEGLEEAAMLRVSSSGSRKRKLSENKSSSLKKLKLEEEVEEEEDDLCDAATLPIEDLENGVNQSHLPPTPPATPLKRLTSSQEKQVFSYPIVA